MAHYYTAQELTKFRLGDTLDTYLINLEYVIPCTVCNRPLISMPLNGNSSTHANC